MVPCPCSLGCLSWCERLIPVLSSMCVQRGCTELSPGCDPPNVPKLNAAGHRKCSCIAWSLLNSLKGFPGNKGSYCSFSSICFFYFFFFPANNIGFLFTVLSLFKEAGEIMVSLFLNSELKFAMVSVGQINLLFVSFWLKNIFKRNYKSVITKI